MNCRSKTVGCLVREGRRWLFNNVRNLIDRHHYAHRQQFTTWPREWSDWQHGELGVAQYEREKRRRPRG